MLAQRVMLQAGNVSCKVCLCRLASSSFLHDSFAHLCTSSYALWTIAPQVESVLGSGTFLSVYYLSGLAGNVLSFEYGDAITVGASSATFGLIGEPELVSLTHSSVSHSDSAGKRVCGGCWSRFLRCADQLLRGLLWCTAG